MLFTEFRFIVFFAVVFAVHWTLRGNFGRKVLLLVASYTFYGAWDWRFLALITGSTALDYVAGARIARARAGSARRAWLWVSLAGNLGSLGLFKYHDFFVTSGAGLLARLGVDAEPRTLGWILPVGISFYTFQSLSYTIDVYRKNLHPVSGFLDFALFVSFFPQLVAGPIVRAADFLPQLREPRRFGAIAVRPLLVLFLIGFIKKACVSDNIAPAVGLAFDDPGTCSPGDLWLGISLFTIRIYCDFSGYSDMAIATAGLLGYHLPKNFDFPYLARSITEFWRRWHISLSTWFRDYLYIPLGGSRVGRAKTARNLMIVFFCCGLWHGAAWTFVAWGLFHGFFLMLERLSPGDPTDAPRRRGPVALFEHAYVIVIVAIGWILFRAPSAGHAARYLIGLVPAPTRPDAAVLDHRLWMIVAGFSAVHLIMTRVRIEAIGARLPDWVFAIAYGAAVALVLPFAASDFEAFIYFQF